jgi:hypothetical protein
MRSLFHGGQVRLWLSAFYLGFADSQLGWSMLLTNDGRDSEWGQAVYSSRSRHRTTFDAHYLCMYHNPANVIAEMKLQYLPGELRVLVA